MFKTNIKPKSYERYRNSKSFDLFFSSSFLKVVLPITHFVKHMVKEMRDGSDTSDNMMHLFRKYRIIDHVNVKKYLFPESDIFYINWLSPFVIYSLSSSLVGKLIVIEVWNQVNNNRLQWNVVLIFYSMDALCCTKHWSLCCCNIVNIFLLEI